MDDRLNGEGVLLVDGHDLDTVNLMNDPERLSLDHNHVAS